MRRSTVRALIFLIIASAPFLVFAPESSAQESDSLPAPATSEEQHMGVIPGSGGILAPTPVNTPPSATAAEQQLDDSLASQTNKPPYDATISQPTAR